MLLAIPILLILFDGGGAYWAPSDGGPVTPVLEAPIRTSSATDGERVLIAWNASDGVRFGLFEQGAIAPMTGALLDDTFDELRSPIALWNGSRYLVFWTSDAMTRAAVITPQGEVAQRVELAEVPSVDDAAANGDTIALIRQFGSDTHSGNVEVILLDADFAIVRRTVVGSILKSTGGGTTFIARATIVPFGSGYYAAWQQSRTSRYEDVVGTRITADGTALDVVPSTREPRSLMGTILETNFPGSGTEIYELELVVHRARVLAIMKRTWGLRVTATAVDANGAIEGPVQIGGKHMMPANAEVIARTDGSLALAWFDADRIAEVQPFLRLDSAPRRRSARH